MAAILSFLIGQVASRAGIKFSLLSAILVAFSLAISFFLDAVLGFFDQALASSGYGGMSTDLLSAFLPSNTTFSISLALTMDMAVISFKRVMLFINAKKDILGA